MVKQKALINQVEKIYNIIDELQYCQIEQFVSIINTQNIVINKLNKLQEYNEIDDMNNSLIDRKLTKIEGILQKMQID